MSGQVVNMMVVVMVYENNEEQLFGLLDHLAKQFLQSVKKCNDYRAATIFRSSAIEWMNR